MLKKNLYGLLQLRKNNDRLELQLPTKAIPNELKNIQSLINADISEVTVNSSIISFALSNHAIKNSIKNPTDLTGICGVPQQYIVTKYR